MMRPAARELARHGIRVMTIAPGYIATPLLLNMPDNVKESLIATQLFPKRFGQPAEYARLCLDIIGNVMLNGDVIRLDAGARMPPR
jgi:NAD(P)-dependent dehydrogenase (short-subunit alcohol dehydrogenase family)